MAGKMAAADEEKLSEEYFSVEEARGMGEALELFDSDLLSHGVPVYEGNPSEWWVGIFVIQKDYLRLHGVQC